jgi:hypothetical protein
MEMGEALNVPDLIPKGFYHSERSLSFPSSMV